ncbi:GPSM2 family protein [Megaselia abdita]
MSSLSASVENLSGSDHQSSQKSNDSSSMCLELALEGERLCKSGDCRAGVAFFQAAIQAGTDDLRTLSAIYSQLGNAYFYLGEYNKAMQYHQLDLTLARSMNDKLGEAKSSGNLGNTLKVMGKFDEAAVCCDRHLSLSRQLGDKLSEGRALYNLGNIYHAKGKHLGQKDPGDFTEEVKEVLQKAVLYYQQNLNLMQDLGERGACGRACGNLGNTYYLLGDFESAIKYHQERLKIAREFGDKAAERRANSNLGNSHIFLGQFEEAADHYKRTLALAIELGERAVEAQSCYSLGNTYTLLRDFPTAIDYHNRHLAIAQELGDRIGESRACWSIGNAYTSIGSHESALNYAKLHYEIAKELDDPVGQQTARVNINDLNRILGLPELEASEPHSPVEVHSSTSSNSDSQSNSRIHRVRRQSMEQLNLIKITPDGKKDVGVAKQGEDDFFELLSRSQSKRMDDQRCSLKLGNNPQPRKPLTVQNTNAVAPSPQDNGNQIVDMIADLQAERMDEQRAMLPGLKNQQQNAGGPQPQPDDAFIDMLMRCQGSRYEEQRSELPPASVTMDYEMGDNNPSFAANENPRRRAPPPPSNATPAASSAPRGGVTVPDEDFFSLIMKVQSGRMEDQRASVPSFNRK